MQTAEVPFDLALPEAAFRLPVGCALLLPSDDGALARQLRRRIAAVPGDLLAHTRRILLARQLEDVPELLGALIDLFIATGSKGRALRTRLLASAKPLLPGDAHRLLERCLASGLSGGGQINCPQSILAEATSGLMAVSRGGG